MPVSADLRRIDKDTLEVDFDTLHFDIPGEGQSDVIIMALRLRLQRSADGSVSTYVWNGQTGSVTCCKAWIGSGDLLFSFFAGDRKLSQMVDVPWHAAGKRNHGAWPMPDGPIALINGPIQGADFDAITKVSIAGKEETQFTFDDDSVENPSPGGPPPGVCYGCPPGYSAQ